MEDYTKLKQVTGLLHMTFQFASTCACGWARVLANIHLLTATVPRAGTMTTAHGRRQDQETPKYEFVRDLDKVVFLGMGGEMNQIKIYKNSIKQTPTSDRFWTNVYFKHHN